MFEGNSFGRSLDIMQRLMDVNLLRQNVTAHNIANADTPNFKREVLNFETSLRAALEQQETFETRVGSSRNYYTNERHIPFERPVDYRQVQPRTVTDFLSTSDNNGNNVDLETESMNLLNQQLAYTLMTDSVAAQFRRINIVLGAG